MKSRRENLIDLLHGCPDGALATHSQAMPGFPFASALPFATDEQHRPIFLISRLAEHTQNLTADPRASLLLRRLLADGEMARVTIVGHVEQIDAEPLLIARYLRYQTEAERLLHFGDFGFFRLEPVRTRVIGGFAQASWLAGNRLSDGPILDLHAEADILAALKPHLPSGAELLGIDCHGLDFAVTGAWQRAIFAAAPLAPLAVAAAARRLVDALPV